MAVALKKVDVTRELNTLVRRIDQRNCIVFIGPGLLLTENGIPFNNAFALSLAEELRHEGVEFDENQDEKMSYMIQRYIIGMNEKSGTTSIKIIDLRSRYVQFMEKTKLDFTLYQKLAKIPFCLVINTNYDAYFQGMLKANFPETKVQFDYYDFNKPPEAEKQDENNQKRLKPTPGNFVVYNLFGLCDEQRVNSLVLTEKEFVRFVCRIHQPNTTLPREITNHFDQNKYCLFLGFDFDFDEWYLKVVVRALWDGSKPDSDQERENPNTLALSFPPYSTGFFYENAYKFYFINEQLDTFLDSVVQKLPPPPTPPPGIQDKPVVKGTKQPLSIVFLSDYTSKEDNYFRNQISGQLSYLIDIQVADLFSEDLIIGENRKVKFFEKMKQADIILSLVSNNFFTTGRLLQLEELSKENQKQPQKIAVLLRPCIERSLDRLQNVIWMPEERRKDTPTISINQLTTNQQELQIREVAEKIVAYALKLYNQ